MKRGGNDCRGGIEMGENTIEDDNDMRYQKGEKDRQQHNYRLTHTTQIEHNEQSNRRRGKPEFVVVVRKRQNIEDRVRSTGNRDGDRQNIINQQGAPTHQSWVATEEFGGNKVAAPASGKLFDD